MRYLPIYLYIVLTLGLTSCGNGGFNNNLSALDTLPAPCNTEENVYSEGQTIKVPVNFDPQTPLTDELKAANLRDMIIKKYYSFENPSNRRKHKKVLHRRKDSNGIVDLTSGGPLTYEEMWELGEEHGHSLSEYFYDAAHIEKYSGSRGALAQDPEFKYVSPTSNLAKVYFVDDFEGFVRFNSSYCDGIFTELESQARESEEERIRNKQAQYE